MLNIRIFPFLLGLYLAVSAGESFAQGHDDEDSDAAEVAPEAAKTTGSSMMAPEHLRVVWILKDGPTENYTSLKPAQKKAWLAACKNLGTALMVGKGPWGFGAFSSVSCWIDTNKVAGKPKPNSWTIEIKDSEEDAKVTVLDSTRNQITEVDLTASTVTVSILDDREFTDLLALRILDSMPMLGYLPKGSISANGQITGRYPQASKAGTYKYPVVAPPTSLTAYSLQSNPKTKRFSAEINGSLKLDAPDAEKLAHLEKSSGQKPAGASIMWQGDERLIKESADQSLWFHSSQGRGRKSVALQAALIKAQAELIDRLGGSTKKGVYRGAVALRYGMSMVKSPDLLKKTKLIGLVTEIRPKGFGGFRLYYDSVPRQSQAEIVDDVSQTTEFGWNRVALGWSFGFSSKNWTLGLIDYVDVTPKASIWNMKSKLNVLDSDGVGTISEFNVNNEKSVGWELGIEKTLMRVLLRGWYGADFLGLFSKVESSTTVKMNRFGLDTWIAGPQFSGTGRIRTSFLAFFWYEKVTFARKNDAEAAIKGIDVTFAYLGLGTGIQW